jgi:hypothetical protein
MHAVTRYQERRILEVTSSLDSDNEIHVPLVVQASSSLCASSVNSQIHRITDTVSVMQFVRKLSRSRAIADPTTEASYRVSRRVSGHW